eukprot:TRINITY_DN15639_c0_g1_i1.p1 TRINITY_DN15639_c0_g1~~TRINITY_DN15639_c0_g1_i1.p1  ORF type:complete len:301 (-),score=93.62 TRINITY_DN15639_c0_g1_i1:13-870(-)
MDKEQGSRPHQEDRFYISEDALNDEGYAIYSVFDGHGTFKYSSHASKNFRDVLVKQKQFSEKNYEEALRMAFHKENEAMLKEIFQSKDGGTTATVALIAENSIFVANVGDSRCIVIKETDNGQVEGLRCSRDHSFSDRLEKERIAKAGGEIMGNRVVANGQAINMTRALGDFAFKAPHNQAEGDWISAIPDVKQIKLNPELKALVLASDGLWTHWDDDKVAEEVTRMRTAGKKPQEIAVDITEAMAALPQSDNVTVIVVFFHWKITESTEDPHPHTISKPIEKRG